MHYCALRDLDLYYNGFFLVDNRAWKCFGNYVFPPVRYPQIDLPGYRVHPRRVADDVVGRSYAQEATQPRNYKVEDQAPGFDVFCFLVDLFSFRVIRLGDHFARASDPYNLYARRTLRPGKPDQDGCWEGYQVAGWTAFAYRTFFHLDRYRAQEAIDTPIVQVIDSHRSFRRACRLGGLPVNYTT